MTQIERLIKRSHQSGLIQIVLLLGLGILILFLEMFVWGYVPVPGDILYLDPIWREAIPDGFTRPNNLLLGDHISQFYVWHTLAADSMQREGHIPLWNPYVFSGQPLVANAQPALFYPPNLLLFWLTPGQVAGVRISFNLFTAGIFTFLWCRTLKISKNGAILAAIAFAFSGALLVGPGHAYANALVWLPLMMWAGEKLLQRKQPFFWSLVISIGLGFSILGGHPETTFHNLLLVALYFLFRLLLALTYFRIRVVVAFVMAGIVGLLIGAIQWLPFAELLSQSATTSRARIGETIFYSPEWLSNSATLVTLLYPNFFGNPATDNYLWPFFNFQNYLEQSMYFGLISVTLAVGAMIASRKNYSIFLISTLALFCLLVALRLPLFEGVSHLPIFSMVNNTRLKWLFTFFAAVLAGFGLDTLRRYILSDRIEGRFAFYGIASVLFVALAILIFVAVAKYLPIPFIKIQPDTFIHHLLYKIFSLQQPKTMATIGVICVVIGIWILLDKGYIRFSTVETVLIGLTFIELMVLGRGYNTVMPESQVFPEVELLEALERETEPLRIMSPDGIFWPNYGAVYGISHIGGYDLPVLRNFSELYRAQGGIKNHQQVWSPDWPLVDWMNIKYIVGTQSLDTEQFDLVFVDEPVKIYRNRTVLPRAYMVYNVEVIKDDQAAIHELTNGLFQFEDKVLLKDNLPVDEQTALQSVYSDNESTVAFTKYDNDEVEVKIETESPGLLVMSDIYAPGWQAQVDGTDTHLYQANHAFRAVFVPAGSHMVTFSYKPFSFQIGRALSIFGLVTCGIGLPLTYKFWK